MHHLTRMHLNPARRAARALLGSPQALHAAVLASFPPDELTEDGSSRVLWRIDRDARHATCLYMCSAAKPDLTHLVEQAGWPTTTAWETRDYTHLLDRLAPGQRWAFRLTANPVRRVRDKDHPRRGAPRGHVTATQQAAWLIERGDRSGFAVASGQDGQPCVLVRDRKVVSFPRQGSTVTIATATFDGVLTVTDRDQLQRTLTSGLGRAKSYGCGLMTLAPA